MRIIDKAIPHSNPKQKNKKNEKVNLICKKYSSTLHVFSINSLCFVSIFSL